MADNQNISDQRTLAGELASSIKSALKDQGDYNDLVKDSLKQLQKVVVEYDKIDSKLNSLYNGQINIKKIQDEISKARSRENLATKELSRITTKLSQDQIRDAKNLSNTISQRIAAQQEGNSDLADQLQEQIEYQQNYLNTEQLSYVAAMQQYKLAQQLTEESQALLNQEKEIYKMLGLGGQSAKLFAEKLGLGNRVYESMVIKARQLNEEGRKSRTEVLGAGLKEAGSAMLESITDPLAVIPFIGTAIGGLAKGLKSALEFILEIDDKTIKFGRNLGLSKEESYETYKNFTRIQESSGKLVTTTANLMEVTTDLSQQLGVNNKLNAEMLETQIELKKIMGLSTEEMGALAQASIITGNSQKSVVTGILSQVEGLKKATGISFNYKQVISEASKLGGVLGLQFAKYPEKLAKSLLITKALGMDLQKVDQIAGSILNFEESIQNQLEAQLLTGKNINLSRAQQLALEGDTAGVAVELTKQFGSANEFLKMNRIQQEAIAKSVGMSREDLADTLKNQEMLSKLGAKDTDNAQKRLQLALSRYKTETQINEALGEGAYQNLTQLSAQEKVAELIEKVKSSIQGFLVNSGVVEYITNAIDYISSPDRVKSLISTLRDGAATVADILKEIALFVLGAASIFSDKADELYDKLESTDIGGMIRGESSPSGAANIVREKQVEDFVIKPLPQDTISATGINIQGGTRLGRTDEMVDLLKQILNENKLGRNITLSVDGQPLATAVARNASLTPAASNLGPRPLR